MPETVKEFERRIARLKADLVDQGRRVLQMVDASVESVFNRDTTRAAWVRENDAVIDKADVDIERACVELLVEIARSACELGEDQIRWILTIVKVNNELERIADESVTIVEQVGTLVSMPTTPPARFRVMANSVIGIVRDTCACFDAVDTKLAQTVLASDDAVDAFEQAVLREMQEATVAGTTPVDFAFSINLIAAALERMNDHCTNIAEQVLYVASGKIVRHQEGHWSEPETPS